jgi:hypothetical protein
VDGAAGAATRVRRLDRGERAERLRQPYRENVLYNHRYTELRGRYTAAGHDRD